MSREYPLYEELTWNTARPLVQKSCGAELTHIIDQINPSKKYKLIRVKFPFGAKIVENGQMNFPIKPGCFIPLTNPQLPENIRANLGYSNVPLGILVKNNLEIYRELDDRIFSVAIANPGIDMGIWEHFGSSTPYSIVSGARSIYMVPRISVASLHKKLKKKFNISSPIPKRSLDDWSVFKDLVNNQITNIPWYSELLLLTKEWVAPLNEKKISYPWLVFKKLLLEKGWIHSSIGRKKVIFDILWQVISQNLNYKGQKTNPYIIDTMKHLLFIIMGALPASAPFDGNEAIGPLNQIQEIYTNEYGLSNYAPTIMVPSIFSLDNKLPVYYSMQNPTLLESTPKSKLVTSNMDDLREIRDLINYFIQEGLNTTLKIDNRPLIDVLQKVCFEFFHGDRFAYGQVIHPTSDLVKMDKRFLYSPCQNSGQELAINGAFIRGCIRICPSIKTS